MINEKEYERRFIQHYESVKDSFKRFGEPYNLSLGTHTTSGKGMIHELMYKLENIHGLKEVYDKTLYRLSNTHEYRIREFVEKHLLTLWHILQGILYFYTDNNLEYDLKDLLLQEDWEITTQFVKEQYILYSMRKSDFRNKQILLREQKEIVRKKAILDQYHPTKIDFALIPDCCIVCKYLLIPEEFDGDSFGCELDVKGAMESQDLVWNPLIVQCNGFERVKLDKYSFYRAD